MMKTLELTWEEVQLCMDAFNVYISRHTYDGTPVAKKVLLAKMMVFDEEYLAELEEEE